jgi:hypothetical protein
MKILLLLSLILPLSLNAQQRYLVSPRGELYLLRDGESASVAMNRILGRGSLAGRCDTVPASTLVEGFPESHYPANSNVAVHHKDVVGEWFVAPAPGIIDSIFWENLGSVGAKDSSVEVRLFKSNIYPGHGPGYYPYPAPCAQWGYYRDANDLDRGVTPFRSEATDPAWVTTSFFGPPTFDPLGDELWDGNGGKTVSHAEGINSLALDEFGDKPHINQGDPFFITFRVNSTNSHPYPPDARTDFATREFSVTSGDPNYPSRNWVFFEHDSAPTMCGFLPGQFVRQGWIALGNETIDSLDVLMYNFWYSMTAEPYVPGAGEVYETHSIAGDSLHICLQACDQSMVDTTKYTWIQFTSGYANDSIPFPLRHDGPSCLTLPRLAESTMVCFEIRSKGFVQYELPSGCFEVLAVETPAGELPRSTELLQNYPNPFNPSTNVKFRIAEAGLVTLKIYDVLGREVATLLDERKSPGEYSVTWNAGSAPSGVYFYKLTSGKFSDVKKLLLVR